MNWKEISETYPKSYGLLLSYITLNIFEYDGIICDEQRLSFYEGDSYRGGTNYNFNERNLFDFFDSQLIRVFIMPKGYELPGDIGKFGFTVLRHKSSFQAQCIEWYKDRQQAESEAFKAAFPILEKRLEGE